MLGGGFRKYQSDKNVNNFHEIYRIYSGCTVGITVKYDNHFNRQCNNAFTASATGMEW